MGWGRLLRRGLLEHRGRTAAAVLAVALGVTLYLGVVVGAGTVTRSVAGAGWRSLGDLVVLDAVGVHGVGAPVGALDGLARLEGVTEVHAGLGGGLFHVRTPEEAGPELTVAVTVTATEDLTLSAGRGPAGPGEVVVDESVAAALTVGPGDDVTVRAPVGEHTLAVVGIQPGAPGGPVVMARPEEALAWAGDSPALTRVVLALADGLAVDAWLRVNRERLGPFQPSFDFASDATEFFASIEAAIAPLGLAALLIGGYLIHLMVSRTVDDRRVAHGTLRAVGGSRRQLVALVVGEAAVIGAVGTLIGVPAGLVVSQATAQAISQGLDAPLLATPGASAALGQLLLAVILGMATPVLAAAVSAWRAATVDPALVTRPAVDHAPRSTSGLVGGALFGAGALLTAALPEAGKPAGVVMALFGVVLAAPVVARATAAVARPVLRRAVPGSGELAAQRLARRPGRTATTAGLLGTSLALVFMVATLNASGRGPFAELVGTHYGADLVAGSNAGTIPDEVLDALAAAEPVAAVSAGAAGHITVLDPGGRTEFLTVIDPETHFDVAGLPWTSGTDQHAARTALAAGGSVVLATSITERIDRAPGDQVTLQTHAGPRTFTIAATYAGLAWGETRAVVMSLGDAERHLGLTGPTTVRLALQDPDGVVAGDWSIDSIVPAFSGGEWAVWWHPQHWVRTSILESWDGAWNLVLVIVAVAGLVAVFGFATTLVSELLQRRRELGLLRALGTHRFEVSRLVVAEAATLALTAGVIGVAAGSVLGRALLQGVATDTGVPHPFTLPVSAIVPVVLIALVAGVLAAVVPARRASRLAPSLVLRQ